MELILTQDVKDLGSKGDVVTVRDGYGRNFLLPRSLAIASTRNNRQFVEEQRARAEKRQAKERAAAAEKAKQLENFKVVIEASVGEEDKLFGSVTAEDIRKALAEKGLEFDKRKIQLKESLRKLGTYSVAVELYPQVKTTIAVEIVAKS